MIKIVKELNIEVTKPNVFQALVAKQYDMNTRFLKVTLTDNGTKVNVPYSGDVKVVINAERQDGQSKGFDGEVNEDGTVTVPLHSWMLELEGLVICDISVIKITENTSKKLTTTSFDLMVEKAAYGGDDITTDPQYEVLVRIMEDCNNAKATAEKAVETSKQALVISEMAVATVDIAIKKSENLIGFKTEEGGEIFNDYKNNKAGNNSHAEGQMGRAEGESSHAEGFRTRAVAFAAHSEGQDTTAYGQAAHSEGASAANAMDIINVDDTDSAIIDKWNTNKFTLAKGHYSHAEGQNTLSIGVCSHSEGYQSCSTHTASHAEGLNTISKGVGSHAEGEETVASGRSSHTEGEKTEASGKSAHAEGTSCRAGGANAHAEGSNTQAWHDNSHTSGEGTKAARRNQTVVGQFNDVATSRDALLVVGNGKSDTDRSNAFAVYEDGTAHIQTESTDDDAVVRYSQIKSLLAKIEELESELQALDR